ncbi:MAG: SufD family Fe-S cluster assembly protein, partial [Xanthomonadaceae bacterium]|nr:SufD family Fe-S cluster assembly protein [Xanthomonadaceae bacterium]
MYYLTDRQRLLAEQALGKVCPYGGDIDLNGYIHEPDHDQVPTYDKLVADERETLMKSGFDVDDHDRAASFLQVNHEIGHCSRQVEGVEVMPMRQALEKYDGLPAYWWQAVKVDADKYTAKVALDFDNGYFIRALAGTKTQLPVQTCLFMNSEKLLQNVHNIIVVEEGAELEIISGCATSHQMKEGLHLGVSELYIKKNARLSFTM